MTHNDDPTALALPTIPNIPLLEDNVTLAVTEAAYIYADAGIPVVPFSPDCGKGKSCWNLVHYRDLTTDPATLAGWVDQFGSFKAIATSPAAIGAVAIDIDHPEPFPEPLRRHLKRRNVPFVWTRPSVHKRKGHYWFSVPEGLSIPNRDDFEWGEVLSTGKGVVLPPYDNRRWGPVEKRTPDERIVQRAGRPPMLPDELLSYLAVSGSGTNAGAGGGGLVGRRPADSADLAAFCREHNYTSQPKKIIGAVRVYGTCVGRRMNCHDAMNRAVRVGLEEACIGYVSATEVLGELWSFWEGERPRAEFLSIAYYWLPIVLATPIPELKAKSDRKPGTDSRRLN